MRSTKPMPGNPWPNGMTITIEDDDQNLTDLLWVRELYGLTPAGPDLPPTPLDLHDLPDTSQRLRRDKRTWEQEWITLWFNALDRYTGPGGASFRPAMHPTTVDALSDEDVHQLMSGPSWRTRFDDTPFADDYFRWLERGSRRRSRMRRVLELDPERVSLQPLIAAWHRGLATIVTIPCSGTHTRTLSSSALLVTEETRFDPTRYSTALTSFTP